MRSLRGRLALIIAALALLAVAAVTVIVALTTNDAIEETLNDQRGAREAIVAELNESALRAETWEEIEPRAVVLADEFDARIVLTYVDGRRIVDTGDGELPALEGVIDPFGPLAEFADDAPFDEDLFAEALIECFEEEGVPYKIDGEDVFFLDEATSEESAELCFEVAAIRAEGSAFGVKEPALLFLGFSTTPAIPWLPIILIGGLVVIAAAVLAAPLSTFVTSPLRSLAGAARSIREGDLDVRVDATSPAEVADLATSFNEMTEALGRAEIRRKQLTADVAHELRSPITNILGYLDAIEDGVIEPTPDQVRIITSESERLARLVDDLQVLAALDEHTLRLEQAPQDLCRALDVAVEARRIRAGDLGVELQRVGACDGMVAVDRTRFDQIIGNLLENALEHTPPGGRITVEIREGFDTIEIAVSDTGPGIDEDVLPYVFDRLSRADASRTPGAGGRGLGLSIARGLARAHGGDITAANRSGGGARLLVTLPR